MCYVLGGLMSSQAFSIRVNYDLSKQVAFVRFMSHMPKNMCGWTHHLIITFGMTAWQNRILPSTNLLSRSRGRKLKSAASHRTTSALSSTTAPPPQASWISPALAAGRCEIRRYARAVLFRPRRAIVWRIYLQLGCVVAREPGEEGQFLIRLVDGWS